MSKKTNHPSIAQYAKFFHKMGYSMSFGKIFGYLISRNSSTFEEIVKDLSLSKGSVSMTLNTMMEQGYVDYDVNIGQRKKHFKISFNNWESGLEKRISNSVNFVNLIKSSMQENQDLSKEQFATLEGLIRFEELFQKKIAEVIEEFTKQS